MNNEIKEMINNIEKMSDEERKSQLEWSDTHEFGTAYAYYLLDYITNLQEEKDTSDDYARHLHNENKKLQEENERLKEIIENLTTMTVCGDRKQIKNTSQYKLDIAQARIDKAIEYMNNYIEVEDAPINERIKIEFKEVIDILQGDDKDE